MSDKKNLERIEILSKHLDDVFTVANIFLQETKYLYLALDKKTYKIRHIFGNWEKYLGWSHDELIGINLLALVHQDDYEITKELIDNDQVELNNNTFPGVCSMDNDLLCLRRDTVFINRIRVKSGDYREMLWQSQKLENAHELVLGIILPGKKIKQL